jgi:predicted nuclease with TOPRIM domain
VKPHVETIEIHSVTSENKSIDESPKVSGDLETLRSKVEEISAQLEEALRESEVLRHDKFRIQEKLTEKKLIEQELSTENKKLKEEVEDLSLRLEEFEKDYAELQDELDEEITLRLCTKIWNIALPIATNSVCNTWLQLSS